MKNQEASISILTDVHHNHIHTVFRAAQKVPGSPVLYDLWTGTAFTPDLESQVSTSREDSETEVYKSAIAECVWDRAVTVGENIVMSRTYICGFTPSYIVKVI